jgi:hypothetical protein
VLVTRYRRSRTSPDDPYDTYKCQWCTLSAPTLPVPPLWTSSRRQSMWRSDVSLARWVWPTCNLGGGSAAAGRRPTLGVHKSANPTLQILLCGGGGWGRDENSQERRARPRAKSDVALSRALFENESARDRVAMLLVVLVACATKPLWQLGHLEPGGCLCG